MADGDRYNFFLCKINSQLLVLYARIFKKMVYWYIDSQKVQIADEIERDIWKYLV